MAGNIQREINIQDQEVTSVRRVTFRAGKLDELVLRKAYLRPGTFNPSTNTLTLSSKDLASEATPSGSRAHPEHLGARRAPQ